MTDHLDAFDGGRAAAAAASATSGDADIRVPGAADPDAVAQASSDAAKLAAMFASLGSQPAPAKPELSAPAAAPASTPAPVATAVAPEPPPPAPAAASAPAPSATDVAARMSALLGGGSAPIASTASAVDAASFADQAPPLERRKPTEEPAPAAVPAPIAAPAPVAAMPPLERRPVEPAAPPPAPAAASQPAPRPSGQCRIVESRDGIRTLLDVFLPGGGGAVIVLTPPRALGDGRSLPAHVGWRGADAVAGDDAKAFARALSDAVDRAAALAPALLD
jgi:hypothetical protein